MQRQGSILLILLAISACGGGSGGTEPPEIMPPPPPPPPVSVTRDEIAAASKFAARASFGLPYEQIEALALEGSDAWLDRQFALPVETHMPTITDLVTRRTAGEFDAFEQDIEFLFQFRRWAWWNCAVMCEDTLRQRVAYALSQIMVVSDTVDELIVYPDALGRYYDVLLNNAFGNFRDLLYDVTLSPAMGVYLSHINNNRSNPAQNTFPDENFAREVMQLFSIGLFELNIDGTRKLDSNGLAIPTYNNDDIREFAKIFTGFGYGGPNQVFGNTIAFFGVPMQMYDANHEPGPKALLNGQVVPAGQSGLQDVNDAIDNLFNHPNVGPFIGKQLIQRLVTSNPSPAYVQRVAEAFNGVNTGVRGDMQAVIRAVLTDTEATGAPGVNFGKLREPVLRYVAILRQFGATTEDDYLVNGGFFFQAVARQHPLSAPSVFNFYLPEHAPAGEIASAELVAPEFEITNSSTIINFTNFVDAIVTSDFVVETPEPFTAATLDFSEYDALSVEDLIERLDLLLTSGNLSAEFRQVITDVVGAIDEPEFRRRVALYMILTSTDYVIEL